MMVMVVTMVIVIMAACLCIYMAAVWISGRILNIEV